MSDCEITIREATQEDTPAIIDIYNQGIATGATGDLVPISIDKSADWLREHEPAKRPLWIAELKGEIVGWLGIRSLHEGEAFNETAVLSLYVSQHHNHAGIGRTLLGLAIRKANEYAIRNFIGFIFAHNKASLNLVHTMGFSVWASLPEIAKVNGAECDVIVVGLRVGNA